MNWKKESVTLACSRFKGCHIPERIYQQYGDEALQFDIADKVRYIITDTASSMVKAFKLSYEYAREDEDEMKLIKAIQMKMIVIQLPLRLF